MRYFNVEYENGESAWAFTGDMNGFSKDAERRVRISMELQHQKNSVIQLLCRTKDLIFQWCVTDAKYVRQMTWSHQLLPMPDYCNLSLGLNGSYHQLSVSTVLSTRLSFCVCYQSVSVLYPFSFPSNIWTFYFYITLTFSEPDGLCMCSLFSKIWTDVRSTITQTQSSRIGEQGRRLVEGFQGDIVGWRDQTVRVSLSGVEMKGVTERMRMRLLKRDGLASYGCRANEGTVIKGIIVQGRKQRGTGGVESGGWKVGEHFRNIETIFWKEVKRVRKCEDGRVLNMKIELFKKWKQDFEVCSM